MPAQDAMASSSDDVAGSLTAGPPHGRSWARLVPVGLIAAIFVTVRVQLRPKNQHSVSGALRASISLDAETEELHADIWIVITSILPLTEQVRHLDELCQKGGWAMVVIGDTHTPEPWNDGERLTRTKFISYEEQLDLPYNVVKKTPTKSYTRKAIGYLWAIKHGAQIIYDTDDDNVLSKPLHEAFYLPSTYDNSSRAYMPLSIDGKPPAVANPYAYFGQPTIWPRGYPLGEIQAPMPTYVERTVEKLPLVQQGVVNGDPDVDAIFRLTRYPHGQIPNVTFDSNAPPFVLPPGTMAPFNSQNTLWWRDAFHLLFIPTTVPFRACDIWRGYFVQRFLWAQNAQLFFMQPTAFQHRTPHDYTKDFMGEMDVYKNTTALINLLVNYELPSINRISIRDVMLDVAEEIARQGLWGPAEVQVLEAWLDDLEALGVNTALQPAQWHLRDQSHTFVATHTFEPAVLPTGPLYAKALDSTQDLNI